MDPIGAIEHSPQPEVTRSLLSGMLSLSVTAKAATGYSKLGEALRRMPSEDCANPYFDLATEPLGLESGTLHDVPDLDRRTWPHALPRASSPLLSDSLYDPCVGSMLPLRTTEQ